MGKSNALGAWGEEKAARFLMDQWYHIIQRNYHSRYGEIDLIAEDPAFGMSREELTAHLEPSRYIGRCPQQVEEFLKEQVAPALAKYQDCLKDEDTELKV